MTLGINVSKLFSEMIMVRPMILSTCELTMLILLHFKGNVDDFPNPEEVRHG